MATLDTHAVYEELHRYGGRQVIKDMAEHDTALTPEPPTGPWRPGGRTLSHPSVNQPSTFLRRPSRGHRPQGNREAPPAPILSMSRPRASLRRADEEWPPAEACCPGGRGEKRLFGFPIPLKAQGADGGSHARVLDSGCPRARYRVRRHTRVRQSASAIKRRDAFMPEQRVLQDTVGAVVRTHTGKPRAHPEGAPSQIHLVLLRYPVRRFVSRISVRRAAPLSPCSGAPPKVLPCGAGRSGTPQMREGPPAGNAGGLRRMYAWGRPVQNTVCSAYPCC